MKVGDVIDGYHLEREIPGGGMALVFEVTKEDTHFALKTPKPDSDENFIKRFKREVRLMQSISSDFVMPVLASNLEAEEPYYIMPLCIHSLEQAIPLMSAELRLQACIDFCRGIEAIHDVGMRHRDIKPQNALYFFGQLKISDMGLGRFVSRDTTTMTTTMGAMGTQGYIPPEYYDNQATFRDGTIEGDIYMLGKSIYVICSGGNPLFVDPSQVDASVYGIIEKCTQLKPENRYHAVKEVIADLIDVKTAQNKLASMSLSIDDILAKRHLIDFPKEVRLFLMAIGNDNAEMARALRKLSSEDLKTVFSDDYTQLPHFIRHFDESLRNPQSYIQFAELDEFARMFSVLFSLCHDLQDKKIILQYLIDYGKGFNRYYVMDKLRDALAMLSDDDIRDLYGFLKKNREDILGMRPNMKQSLPNKVNMLLTQMGNE